MQRQIASHLARAATRRLQAASCRPCLSSTLATRRLASLPSSVSNRKFSASTSTWGQGENDANLIGRLASELSYEKENGSGQQEPEFLQTFKSNSVWEIEDKAGADEVALTRKFGNEKIRVLFSIADIDNQPETSSASEESGADTAEEGTAEAAEQEAEAEQGASLPIRTAITITKGAGSGALTIDAVAQDGMFLVDNVTLYPDEQVANELTPEADWKRRGLYMGPAFDHLDEGLQTDFEAFLEERGIDSSLALFIPDLAEYKEQKEYIKWLEGVQKFVEA